MFIVTAKAGWLRRILPLLLLLLAAAAVILHLRGRSGDDPGPALRAASNEERVAYLASLGWEVDSEPLEALRLTLPETMEEPYRSYNTLQQKQGFDLTPCLGKSVERYTYRLRNYPGRPDGCQADLYLCDGRVVAGDVICTGANGFIDTLAFPDGSETQIPQGDL